MAIGVILGTVLAAGLKTKPLILFFTIVVYILAFYLLFLKEKEENLDVKMSLPARIIAGLVSGFISAPMGIGGAVMNVPILTVNGVRFSLEDGSWGLIRASSNKPSLVVVTESPTSDDRKRKIFEFIDSLLQKTGKVGEYDQKI